MNMIAVQVKYEFIEGHHVFTSNDVRGLLVVSKDATTAFDDVTESIKILMKLNENIDCEVSPLKSIDDFIQEKRTKSEPVQPPALIRLSNQRYALSACA